MPFVNETASEQDITKYGLREQNKEFGLRNEGPFDWTIDREQNTYLRHMQSNGREDPVTETFLFYWLGNRVNITLETVHFFSKKGEYLEQTRKIQNSFWLPEVLEPMRKKIITDFKSALIALEDGNCAGRYKEYKFNFEF